MATNAAFTRQSFTHERNQGISSLREDDPQGLGTVTLIQTASVPPTLAPLPSIHSQVSSLGGLLGAENIIHANRDPFANSSL